MRLVFIALLMALIGVCLFIIPSAWWVSVFKHKEELTRLELWQYTSAFIVLFLMGLALTFILIYLFIDTF